ncbi:uncharacterized protein LOC133815146 [Humulus lupulus]|uniref:uncharacterized protein LOC133815146 n=1 Tax=Humulus lupulus TaxID=3486 RepID=UPI002B40BD4B|nr:uncharacterized protein LOC133815146 [Humulus lupulus]
MTVKEEIARLKAKIEELKRHKFRIEEELAQNEEYNEENNEWLRAKLSIEKTQDQHAPSTIEKITNEDRGTEDKSERAVAPLVSIEHHVKVPFQQRLCKNNLDKKFAKFLEVFKKLHINIPFAEDLKRIPSYLSFMKEILSKKCKMGDYEKVILMEESSSILQRKLPHKLRDPGSFTIP